MSQIDPTFESKQRQELLEEKNASENDENYETGEDEEEEEEEEEISGSIATRNTGKGKKEKFNFRRKNAKLFPGRLTVSLRNRKSIRHRKAKKPVQNTKGKKISISSSKKKISEKRFVGPRLGKRCRSGGKAKVKPFAAPAAQDKNDSDDDGDNTYFSRISLGQFQQLKDKSGACTSYQREEDRRSDSHILPHKAQNKNSEEELRELQMWGRDVLDTYYCTVNDWGNYTNLLRQANK